MEKVKSSIKLRQDGHYEMSLPLKDGNMKFPNNKPQAIQRMNSLKRRFEKNRDFQIEYTNFVNDMISNSYAEKIEKDDSLLGRTGYICHYAVYHPAKHKIRVPFDCSAKYNGISINDALLQGPDLSHNVFGVLTRLRRHSIGMQSVKV